MYLSKTMIVRGIMVIAVVVVLWSLWKRVDAVIDNYQKYYDIALIQKLWNEQSQKFDEEFNKRWDEFDRKWAMFNDRFGSKENTERQSNPDVKSQEKDIDKKWEEYQKRGPFQAENKPVPMVADEFTKGYYHGLWNFFITSGFASIFAALFFIGLGFFIIRWLWNKINDELINKVISKIM